VQSFDTTARRLLTARRQHNGSIRRLVRPAGEPDEADLVPNPKTKPITRQGG
jgi:hypothetical protein